MSASLTNQSSSGVHFFVHVFVSVVRSLNIDCDFSCSKLTWLSLCQISKI